MKTDVLVSLLYTADCAGKRTRKAESLPLMIMAGELELALDHPIVTLEGAVGSGANPRRVVLHLKLPSPMALLDTVTGAELCAIFKESIV